MMNRYNKHYMNVRNRGEIATIGGEINYFHVLDISIPP